MPVASTDIVCRLSGGASNSSAAASLGGAKSSVAAPSSLFDTVAGAEASAGDIEYRCIYVHNASTDSTMTNATAWITSNTPSGSTTIDIGLGSSAINGTEQTVANESAAPTGVTFGAAASKAAGLALGSLAPGQSRAIWYRRTVTGGAAVSASDPMTLRVECEA